MLRADLLQEIIATDTSEIDTALARVLKADAAALGVERVGLWQLSHDPFRLTLVSNYIKTGDRFETGVELVAAQYPSYFTALDINPLIVANDAQTDPRTAEFAESYLRPNGIVSMMDVPVWSGGRLVGVVCHEHVGPPRTWRDDEQSFALSIGAVVAAMLELRARREAERRTAALLADVAAAQKLAGDRAETLAIVSHDLRAPLSSIHTTAALLELETPKEAQTTHARLGRIRRAVRVMDHLITDLLEASRLDAGHALPLEREPHAIDDIISDVVELVRDQALDKRVSLELRLMTGGLVLSCDSHRLGQVLANLVGNAIKFTPQGGRVCVASSTVDGGKHVRVCVQDEGPGVRLEDREQVFHRYWRGPRGQTGLGLYIAKAIVEAHGGTIRVADGERSGAVFEVELPV